MPIAQYLGLLSRGPPPRLFQAPQAEHLLMAGYAGLIALDALGQQVAISSYKGSRALLYNVDTGYQMTLKRSDLCGLAVAKNGMIATDGLGGVFAVQDDDMMLLVRAARAWDNHIIAV